ncbi:MAG: hypothetical protein AAGK37_06665 [Pseudomonadota bacterium]
MAHRTLFDRIEKLLREERAALVSGNVAALPVLSARRDRLLTEIAQAPVDPVRLKSLRGLALRNAELAGAARNGVQAAIARLADIRAAAGPISSYSASGARSHIGAARPAFERKA